MDNEKLYEDMEQGTFAEIISSMQWCGSPVETSAKQKHRPSRQARPFGRTQCTTFRWCIIAPLLKQGVLAAVRCQRFSSALNQ